MQKTNSPIQVAEIHLNKQICKVEFLTISDLVESVKEMLFGASEKLIRDTLIILHGYQVFRWNKFLDMFRFPLEEGRIAA